MDSIDDVLDNFFGAEEGEEGEVDEIKMTLKDGASFVLRLPKLGSKGEMTLEDYRLGFLSGVMDRRTCLACMSSCQIETKPINTGMAITAGWMCGEYHRMGRTGYIDMQQNAPEFIKAHCRDYTVLRRWDFINRPPGTDSKSKAIGLWAVKPLMYEWVQGRTTVPLRTITYKDRVLGYSAEGVSFVEASQRAFDFDDLWAGTLTPLKVKKGRKWVDPNDG